MNTNPLRLTSLRIRAGAVLPLFLAVILLLTCSIRAQALSVPLYGQRWEPWQDDLLGHSSSSTVGRYGCAVTCVAMVLRHFGVQTDPGDLNGWMKDHGGFSGDLIIWGAAAGRGGGVSYEGRNDWQNVPADLGVINNELDNGFPVIAEVRLSGAQHFVVLTGRNGDTYAINDPWYGDQTTLNARYGTPTRAIYGIRRYHGNAEPRVDFYDTPGRQQWTNELDRVVVRWSIGNADVWGQSWDGDPGQQFQSSDGNMIFRYIEDDNARQGWHRIRVRAWRGGRFWDFDSAPYGYDSRPPTVRLTGGPAPGSVLKNPARVDWHLDDSHSGLKHWGQAWDSDPGPQFSTGDGWLEIPEGVHTLHVHAWDQLDNNRDWTFGEFTVLPPTPGGLSASAVASTRIELTWQDRSSTEEAFEIERREGSGGFATIGAVGSGRTSFADTGVRPGTSYTYRVRAVTRRGSSDPSNEAGASTPAASVTAPAGLQATAASPTQVTLAWRDQSDNEEGFQVWRRAGTESAVQVGSPAANATTFSDPGLAVGTTYTYQVRAFNGSVLSAFSNEATVTTPLAPITAPTDLQVSANSPSQVALTWRDRSDNEEGFQVWRRAGTGSFIEVGRSSANSATYTDTAVTASTSYGYRVRAYGNGAVSGYSNEVMVTTPAATPAAPSGLSAVPTGPGSIRLAWMDNSDNEEGFTIRRRTGGAGEYVRVGEVSRGQQAFEDTACAAATSYTYRVYAFNGAGESAASEEASAVTPAPMGDAYEPDDSPDQAKPVSGDGDTQAHTFHVATDIDYVKLEAPAGALLYAETVDLSSGCDTVLTLLTADGATPLAVNDDYDPTLRSVITRKLEAVGTYYLRVHHYGSRGEGKRYSLRVRVSSLEVTTPNGGEMWQAGQAAAVRWKSRNLTGTVTLDFSPDNGTTWQTVATGAANSGSYTWSLPELSTTQAKVRVTSEVLPDCRDESDAPFAIQPGVMVGTGNGLRAAYYLGVDLAGAPVVRTESAVDHDWGSGSPVAGIPADYFSVRWTGQIQAERTAVYTFHAWTDDGVRLRINGQVVIDHWSDQPITERTGTISLQAGRKYDLVMEYYERGGGAIARLLWSTPGLAPVVVPQAQGYSTPVEGVLDRYEPDNTTGSATEILLNGAAQDHTLDQVGDQDFLRFRTTEEALITVETFDLANGCDTVVTLLAEDASTELASDDDSAGRGASRVTYVAPGPGTYFVRVRDRSTGAGSERSYRIRVRTSPVPGPWLRLLQPTTTSVWTVGSSATIAWSSREAGANVRIELSRNGGATWSTLVTKTPNDGSYRWQVQGAVTSRARIRISAVTFPSCQHSGNGEFRIERKGRR